MQNWNGEEVHYDSMGNRWAVDLTGKRFADVCFLFEHAVPFGIHLANPVTLRDPDGTEYTTKIMVNPQGDWVIDEGDEIIVIAEDDDSYYPGRLQMVDPGPTPVMSEAAQMPVNLMLVGFRRDLDDMISEVSAHQLCRVATPPPIFQSRVVTRVVSARNSNRAASALLSA